MKELNHGYRGFNFVGSCGLIVVFFNLIHTMFHGRLWDQASIPAVALQILVVLLLTLFLSRNRLNQKRKKNWEKYEAKVVEIRYNKNIWFCGMQIGFGPSKNMNHPFQAVVKYQVKDGSWLMGKSKLYYYAVKPDAESFLAFIYIHPADPKKQYIQLFYTAPQPDNSNGQ